jgi:rhamnose transport system ATP-binding protein
MPVLSAAGISKRFAGTVALQGVDLELYPGEVHALVGENGSGKSTLLRVLAGALRPDAGELRVDGRLAEFHRPRDATDAGVVLVTQEGSLMPDLSVAENILVGRLMRRRGGVDWAAMRQRTRQLLDSLQVDVAPGTAVRALPPDQRRLVEVARALSYDARVLLLDEPTSALDVNEVSSLLDTVRSLAGRGMAVVLVSHRMSELTDVSQRFTVLRDGERVASRTSERCDEDWLVRAMVGRDVLRVTASAPPASPGPVLRVSGVREAFGRVRDVSLSVGSGEIVGLAGLVGAGRSELLETIVGLRPRSGGEVTVDGKPVGPGVRSALESGLVMVAEDRQSQALVPLMSVHDNATLTMPLRRGRLQRRRRVEAAAVEPLLRRLEVRPAGREQPIVGLSGGNQQKVMLARALVTAPKVVMLDEPTRGIDLGAKQRIYEHIIGLAAEGIGVLVASSELPELLALCHRVAVMREGQIVAELGHDELSEEAIVAMATGAAAHAA